MTEAIGNIGSFLGSIGSKLGTGLKTVGSDLGTDTGKGLLTLGTLGGGFLQNLMAARQANAKQKFVQDLITDPAKFNALVAKTEQPLSQGLTTDIARQADAYGAERGLGSSPAIMKDVYAQALAPAQMQEQQMAINSLIQRLGIYGQSPTMAPINVGPMLQALMMSKGTTPTNPTTGIDLSNAPPTPFPSWALSGPAPLPNPAIDTGDFGTLGIPGFGGDTTAMG